jgi:hypothetical protein
MYVATKLVGTPLGVMGNGVPAAPGLGLMPVSDFTGDYSTVEVDPTDGMTFWAANEYIGADGGINIWRTRIVSFQATVDPGADFYAVRVKGGDSLDIAVNVPASGPGQFDNAFVPAVYLYDPQGQLVAYSEASNSDDRGVTIHFKVPGNGRKQYTIRVAPSPSTPQPTEGEYALVVSGSEDDGPDEATAVAPAPSGSIGTEASGPTAAVGGGDGRGAAIANLFAVGRWQDRAMPGVLFTPIDGAPSSRDLPKRVSARAVRPDMARAAVFEVGRHYNMGFTRIAAGRLQGLRRSSVPMQLMDR